MGSSRRRFIRDSLATVGALAIGPLGTATGGCKDGGDRPGGFREFEPAYLALARNGTLAERDRALWSIFEKCHLCPRTCEVNRLAGQNKICGSTAALKVHSAGAHHGEERPLVGKHGSGTIFFSNCNLLCCFCQNWEIAHRGDGGTITHRKLAQAMLALQEQGCHNINLVTPTHVVPHIVRALRYAVADGLRLPLVYNTGGYDKLETLRLLDGIVDIYMPDFKFQDGDCAHRYCAEARDYPQVAAAAVKEMHRQVGVLQTDERGIASRGLILRHLVMPSNLAGTDRFVQWVARELSTDTYVNLMAQYRPAHEADEYPEIARSITGGEWNQALAWAREAGLSRLDT